MSRVLVRLRSRRSYERALRGPVGLCDLVSAAIGDHSTTFEAYSAIVLLESDLTVTDIVTYHDDSRFRITDEEEWS